MFNGLFSFTSTGPFAAMHGHEWFPQCPPQAWTPPSTAATTAGERDGPVARPTIAHGSVFLSQLLSPPRIEPSPVHFTGQFPDHSLPPSLLQNQVRAFDFLPLLRWHGVITPQSLLALALFEGLVFSRGLETGDSLVVSLAATALTSSMPSTAAFFRARYCRWRSCFFFTCGSMVQLVQSLRAHVGQRT